METFEKFLVEFTKCLLVVLALGSWTIVWDLDDFVIYEQVVFPSMMLSPDFSLCKTFWTWSGHGRLLWTS